MQKIDGQVQWCGSGLCPCPVKQFLKRRMSCFTMEEVITETKERKEKVESCLNYWLTQDFVCRDGKLWCPDYPN